jgi:hypothetical protein
MKTLLAHCWHKGKPLEWCENLSRKIGMRAQFSLQIYLGEDDAGEPMPDGISLDTIVVASKDNVSCALGEEAAILHMRSGVYYGLDPVGARIWKLLDQPTTVENLRTAIVDEYDVEPAKCERDLLALLEKLRTEGLIEVRGA